MDWVWYAGYGSNLYRHRFAYYIGGGSPPGARRSYPGCRDTTAPRAERGLRLPGEIYFAWESPTWGGGVAFFRPDPARIAYARAYLISGEQFADVVAQEMHRDPGPELNLAEVLGERDSVTLGPGRYETMCKVGTIDEVAVVTFTASWDHRAAAVNAPSAGYLELVCAGLRDTFGWEPDRVADYLTGLAGIAGHWSRAVLTEIAARSG